MEDCKSCLSHVGLLCVRPIDGCWWVCVCVCPYLPEEDVAVCAEVERLAVLLQTRVAADQLEVHLLPLQLALLRHDEALADLQTRRKQ